MKQLDSAADQKARLVAKRLPGGHGLTGLLKYQH
jgi:hypothetical protein